MGAQRHDKSIRPPADFVQAVAGTALTAGGDVELPPNTRGLLVNGAGLQDVTMQNGNTRDLLPLVQGVNPGLFKTLRVDASNTATDIWAIV